MSMLSDPVHVSLGAYGRVPHLVAIADALADPPSDPLLGRLDTSRMQICPQNTGVLDLELCQQLREQYPHIEWRLHANVRTRSQHGFIDLADWPKHEDYFSELGKLSRALSAPAYSAHAGKRSHASVEQVIDYSCELTDLFGIPVAIEGHYPMPDDRWLFSSWAEYRQLLESDAYFALDLSHLHILASRTRTIETGLVREMLSCERCIEVHVSHNDGQRDQHLPLVHLPWWLPVLRHTDNQAAIFSEGRVASLIP
ncbi:hypothetical protein [Alcanivorax sp.]|uniref:hypothetical protein n=1 Tax=Alcanivorax sp. TaxID=1872427 RepID=UPI0025C10B29|nr:hypothetical protein [Alcanivorax sp.]